MKRALPLILLVTACFPTAELQQGPGIIGSYVVNGVDPIGTEYTGRVEIRAGDSVDKVDIEWIVTGAILRGNGEIDGDELFVAWSSINAPAGPTSGTATYTIMSDGRLVGTRTVEGFDEVGTETIFPDP